MKSNSHRLARCLLALVLSGAASPAFTQAFPARPIHVLSATGVGNPGDVTLRLLTPRMTGPLIKRLGITPE